MGLATVILASGRDIELTGLEIFSTYSGLLEGYPNARMNDSLLARLAKRRESAYRTERVHVIDPPRHHPDPGSERLAFGPVEVLPAVHCRASFESHPVDESLETVLYRSRLTIVWFQDDVTAPVGEFVTAAVRDLAWEDLAGDDEL